jgi:DUF917 family protein
VPFELNGQDLDDLARGAAFLGTGGGGNPYVGRLLVDWARAHGGRIELIALEELGDEALVIPTAGMGAPTVAVEKLPRGDEAAVALRVLERHLGRTADATMPIECGGINSMVPLVVGILLDLPVVDADGMGRAFPELQMETFNVYGAAATPMAIADERGSTAIVTTRDAKTAEWLARGLTIRMGGHAMIAEYPMDGATAKRVSIPGTLGLGIRIGRAIREAREGHRDPFEAIAGTLAGTLYHYGHITFEGKVVDVLRRTTEGFARGHARIEDADGDVLEIVFQNEHLVARVDGDVHGIVPDLICVLEAETAEPITTEAIRYGQRVKVMVVSTPEIMRTPEALAVFGPRAFGLDEDFQPIEELAQAARLRGRRREAPAGSQDGDVREEVKAR